jgi:hypothetical protein
MQNETYARPSGCTARSHRIGAPTDLGRSAFERSLVAIRPSIVPSFHRSRVLRAPLFKCKPPRLPGLALSHIGCA